MDASYVAGFFDGEGHARIKRKIAFASLTQADRQVLDEIVEYLGYGRVESKYDKRSVERGWKSAFQAVFQGLSARRLLVLIEPMVIVKRDVVASVLDECGRDITDRRRKSNLII